MITHQSVNTQSGTACGRIDWLRDATSIHVATVTCGDCLRVLRDPERFGLSLRALPRPLAHEGGIEEIEAMNKALKREIRQDRWRRFGRWLRSQLFSGHGVRENRYRSK